MQTSPQTTQTRLLTLAGAFLFLYAVSLTLSPAVRARTWTDFRWEHWLGMGVWLGGVLIAQHQFRRHAPHHDPYLFSVVALLSGWGLLTIYRLLPGFGFRQTAWLALGFLMFSAGLRLPKDLGFLRRYKYLWLTGGLLLTAATLFFGTNPANTGPEQWLGCCGIYLQPSEPLKFLLIAYLAAYLADRTPTFTPVQLRQKVPRFTIPLLPLLAPTAVMTGFALLLLVVQRDLGTASIFLIIYASMIYLGTGYPRLALVILGGLLLVSVAGYAFFDLVRLRVDAWLNPWADPAGRSYQVVQSLIAVAAGEIFGRGPGLGNPGLVPLAHSDFIFTAITEENGLIGVVGLLGLIALVVYRGLHIALHAPDQYRRFLAAGLTSYLAAQSLMIIGGNLRMLPLTGVTLPFLSYGGSSLMTSFVCLLLLTLIGSTPRKATDLTLSQTDSAPTLMVNNIFLAGIGAAALVTGWWTVVRGPDLLTRTDNPRQAIADRFVYRGFFLDQNGKRLVINQGTSGNYSRDYLEPSLAPVIGYSSATFGQAGLEASLDSYLRGLENPSWLHVWFDQFIYGQHPPGSDIRLSIDLNLQQIASEKMTGQTGAVVMLNAQSGEVLAMVSTPSFDPNELDATWEALLADPRGPLLNRATQGAYPPGAILGPLLLAETAGNSGMPILAAPTTYPNLPASLTCTAPPANQTWPATIQNGCPAPTAQMGERLGGDSLLALFQSLGLYTSPAIRLPSSSDPAPAKIADPALAALGTDLHLSPLQVALAMATLSNNGVRPAPRLALAYHAPQIGWTLLPPLGGQETIYSSSAALLTAKALTASDLSIWETLAQIEDPKADAAFTWFAGGTLPDWEGAPVVVVVLLEKADVDLAREIGEGMLGEVIK